MKGGVFGRRRAVQAVDGVDFSVLKGETLGVVGESGCGKSTTARLLVRLMTPDAGTVVFDGESVGDALPLRDYRRQVQMVFQDSYASLNPRLTIEDSIAFGPRVHGVPRGPRRAAPATCWRASGWSRGASPAATRTSCPAASASASTSPARWRWSRGSSSSTRRSPRSTSRWRRRCSTCCST